jgi:hypothetical protein
MAKRPKRAELIKAREFHVRVVELLRTRHADWSDWEETFLIDNVQRPEDYIYSEAQWGVLNRLSTYAKSFTQYDGYTIQELLVVAYPARFDLDEDSQEFLETLARWKATDLKRRQIRRLAGIARQYFRVGYDDLEYVEQEKEQEKEMEFAA